MTDSQYVPILDRPEERPQSSVQLICWLDMQAFQSSIAPKSDRNTIVIMVWGFFPFQSSIAPKSDRNQEGQHCKNLKPMFQSSIAPKSDRNIHVPSTHSTRIVPILDRPEERPQWRAIESSAVEKGSNPRSPRRATAIPNPDHRWSEQFVPILDRPEERPQCKSLSIGAAKYVHVPILDRPEERPQSSLLSP